MDTEEVKKILQVPDDSMDAYIGTMLPLAVEHVQAECNDDFKQDDELKLPGGVKIYIAKLIEYMSQNPNVASESVADLSMAFFSNEIPSSLKNMLGPYRKLRW